MATTTFSGPIKAGTISNTTGTTVGTNVKNTGQVVMAQTFTTGSTLDDGASAAIAPPDKSIACVCAITTWPVFFISVPTVVPVVLEIVPALIGPENVVVAIIIILLVCVNAISRPSTIRVSIR